MALLMHWLSQAETVRLDEGPHSFFALTMRWLQAALGTGAPAGDAENRHEAKSPSERHFVLKYFDYLEANADQYWEVPQWQSGEFAGNAPSQRNMEAAGSSSEKLEDDDPSDDDVFSAAYENMVYRDSTGDGIDADMLEAPGAADASNDELERELRRLSPRLNFLAMLATQWKMMAWATSGAAASPNKIAAVEIHAPQATRAQWLVQAQANRRQLLRLAAAIQRYPLTVSSASYDALLEYDRRRLTREMLLEKVIGTLTATLEAEFLLAAGDQEKANNECKASDQEKIAADAPKEFAPGPHTIALFSAVMASDAPAVRVAWRVFLAEIAQQPLLYVPLSKGGDAQKIAAARTVQQIFRELLRRLPPLGLLRETCQLLRVARVMEKEHSPGAGAVTEFDRLFEIGYQGIVDSMVESSLAWDGAEPSIDPVLAEFSAGQTAEHGGPAEQAISVDPSADFQLIDCLQQVTESLLTEWLSHSRTLRLSVLERVTTEKAWHDVVKFVERYGHDLFTQYFFQLGTLQAILHQGVEAWLERLTQTYEPDDAPLLLKELDHGLSRAEARKQLSLIIEAVKENFSEFRDYNATTTQSDRGEMLYTLLDFLRVKVGYERIHWNLRPVAMAHEVLVQRGLSSAAELWRRAMAQRTAEAADQQLARLGKLQSQYGMRLSTIADRLGERFVRPLVVDRVRALIRPAAEEARRGQPPAAFALLEQEASELADEPCGAGLDVPDWLELLEDEANRVCRQPQGGNFDDELPPWLPRVRLTWEEIQTQLTDWDTPPEISSVR